MNTVEGTRGCRHNQTEYSSSNNTDHELEYEKQTRISSPTEDLGKYVEAILQLYAHAQRNVDPNLQSIVDSTVANVNTGPPFHLIYVGFFGSEFKRGYGIDAPAFSLGLTFLIPAGLILIDKKWKGLPQDWLRFVLLHELAHILLNHAPQHAVINFLWGLVPKDLQNAWISIKQLLFVVSVITGNPLKFPSEEITATEELAADEWAVKTMMMREPAIDFLTWLKKQGITYTHTSSIGGLPALTVDERIRCINHVIV